MYKVLIVVDMQNDFIYGPLGTPEARAIVPNIEKKVKEYTSIDDAQIFFTRDTHDFDYFDTQEGKKLHIKHCIYGSSGWRIIPELEGYARRNFCFDKETFGYEDWNCELPMARDIESIELIGVCTDICVVSNALILKAQFPEVEITVDASCCAGIRPENHRAALQVMKSCQINVIGD